MFKALLLGLLMHVASAKTYDIGIVEMYLPGDPVLNYDIVLENINEFVHVNSVGEHDVKLTIYRTPKPDKCYDLVGNTGTILEIAGEHDHYVILGTSVDLCITWSGLGQINGNVMWVNGWVNANRFSKVLLHELGHNLGLFHASVGPKVYGNDFSVMGSGKDFYLLGARIALGWIPPNRVVSCVLSECVDFTIDVAPSDSATEVLGVSIDLEHGNTFLFLEMRPEGQLILTWSPLTTATQVNYFGESQLLRITPTRYTIAPGDTYVYHADGKDIAFKHDGFGVGKARVVVSFVDPPEPPELPDSCGTLVRVPKQSHKIIRFRQIHPNIIRIRVKKARKSEKGSLWVYNNYPWQHMESFNHPQVGALVGGRIKRGRAYNVNLKSERDHDGAVYNKYTMDNYILVESTDPVQLRIWCDDTPTACAENYYYDVDSCVPCPESKPYSPEGSNSLSDCYSDCKVLTVSNVEEIYAGIYLKINDIHQRPAYVKLDNHNEIVIAKAFSTTDEFMFTKMESIGVSYLYRSERTGLVHPTQLDGNFAGADIRFTCTGKLTSPPEIPHSEEPVEYEPPGEYEWVKLTNPPTLGPTKSPTMTPTGLPSTNPIPQPTKSPSMTPTGGPTETPTFKPTGGPSMTPTGGPTETPTPEPTFACGCSTLSLAECFVHPDCFWVESSCVSCSGRERLPVCRKCMNRRRRGCVKRSACTWDGTLCRPVTTSQCSYLQC